MTSEMYGIIGEDLSDVNTLKVIIRRLLNNERLPIKPKGYRGCGELLSKGARQLKAFSDLGCTRHVVCYDADGPDGEPRRQVLFAQVLVPSGVSEPCCAVIPVQELEAWILADIEAVTNVFSSWRPARVNRNPETINSPKEFLERLSNAENGRPRYAHAVHNERIAQHLNLEIVANRCPSFRKLSRWVLDPEAQTE